MLANTDQDVKTLFNAQSQRMSHTHDSTRLCVSLCPCTTRSNTTKKKGATNDNTLQHTATHCNGELVLATGVVTCVMSSDASALSSAVCQWVYILHWLLHQWVYVLHWLLQYIALAIAPCDTHTHTHSHTHTHPHPQPYPHPHPHQHTHTHTHTHTYTHTYTHNHTHEHLTRGRGQKIGIQSPSYYASPQ